MRRGQTDMTKAAFDLALAAGKESKMGVLNPLLRQGIAVEVAHTALFLASGEFRRIRELTRRRLVLCEWSSDSGGWWVVSGSTLRTSEDIGWEIMEGGTEGGTIDLAEEV